jgi:hypothetical protein
MWVEENEGGGKSIRISISRISVEKEKKRNKIQNDPGTSLFFLFLLRRMAPVFSPFFVPFTEFPFCRLFLPFSFYSPNASFIILFPLL